MSAVVAVEPWVTDNHAVPIRFVRLYRCSAKRMAWTDDDKRNIVADIAKIGYTGTLKKHQVTSALLSRWRREIQGAPAAAIPAAAIPKPADPPPEAATADDAVAVAVGHLRSHRDQLAAKLEKLDAVLAALDGLDGETS